MLQRHFPYHVLNSLSLEFCIQLFVSKERFCFVEYILLSYSIDSSAKYFLRMGLSVGMVFGSLLRQREGWVQIAHISFLTNS
jgi:hypothetical protein